MIRCGSTANVVGSLHCPSVSVLNCASVPVALIVGGTVARTPLVELYDHVEVCEGWAMPDHLSALANLAVNLGAAVRPGQELIVQATLDHAPLVAKIAEAAY